MTEDQAIVAPSTRMQAPTTIAGTNRPRVSHAGIPVGGPQTMYRRTFPSNGAVQHARGISASHEKLSPAPLEPEAALPPDAAEQMDALRDKIRTLRTAEGEKRFSAKRTRAELAKIRKELSQSLHASKAVLVGCGREGKWQSFVREVNIPLSTANRLVLTFEQSLNPSEKLLSEQLSPPIAEQIAKMVAKLQPKLTRVLTTEDSVTQFMSALGTALHVNRQVS